MKQLEDSAHRTYLKKNIRMINYTSLSVNIHICADLCIMYLIYNLHVFERPIHNHDIGSEFFLNIFNR